MIVLGIGGIMNDAACAILIDGRLVAAVEESKLMRRGRPQSRRLPEASIAMCLDLAKIKAEKVDCVAVVRPIPAAQEGGLHLNLRERFPNSRMALIDHHRAHAASAFYASPFNDATVLVLDRRGDFRCGSSWRASGGQLLLLEKELYSPDSLGELYGRVTELLGFHANADEHKVQWMSMAAGDKYRDVFLDVLGRAAGEWPRLDRSYFDSEHMTEGGFSAKFFERLGLTGQSAISNSQRAEIAAGLQKAIEQTVISMAGAGGNLCFAGGLAMNALLVEALESSGKFSGVFVQPAGGNAGTALGAVLEVWHGHNSGKQRVSLDDLCLGPSYSPEQIKKVLENCKLRFRYLLTEGELIDTAVAQLSENKIVAWMHGRMEFGPRALGNRSILASPLDPYSAENLNTYIKHREAFRKFAASVPAEVAAEYFEAGPNARYLATVGHVRERYRKCFESAILAGDLVRVHAVAEQDNPLYWKLLHAAGKKTGLPVLYNTSFNLFGEPLVCTPRDAVRSFYSSGIDALFVGNFFLQK
ncbi:MAG TPA: carbamoyltransferase C-terminal domain-containing protein [Bryobacteraceae bacterium]|nr:carbamoyltransferase C-terminal domain-containing protein [Bryobacteraceae bacterium]